MNHSVRPCLLCWRASNWVHLRDLDADNFHLLSLASRCSAVSSSVSSLGADAPPAGAPEAEGRSAITAFNIALNFSKPLCKTHSTKLIDDIHLPLRHLGGSLPAKRNVVPGYSSKCRSLQRALYSLRVFARVAMRDQ